MEFHILSGVMAFLAVLSSIDGYIATTKNGLVRGTKERTSNKLLVYYAFRSIPFAEPPVGPLRFEAPQAVKNWTGILDATKERDICVQGQSTLVRTDKIIGSEDCLYLTVYTPKSPNPKNSTTYPVMVWTHGGGFFQGDNSNQLYAPDYFLEEGVVVVSITYRLGVFGFLTTDDLLAPGNNGLRDQILALNWVKDNVEFFGGHRDKITVWGESAGSISISHLLCSPKTEGLYNAAIMQSGSSLTVVSVGIRQREMAFKTGEMIGIQTNSSGVLLAALKSVDYKTLFANSFYAGIMVTSQSPFDTYPFTTVIEPPHDNAVVTESSYQCLENGRMQSIPILLGFNTKEAEGLSDSILKAALSKVWPDIVVLSPSTLNIQNPDIAQEVGCLIKQHFFTDDVTTYSEENYLNWFGFYHMIKATIKQAELASTLTDVYLYQFSYVSLLGNPLRQYWNGVGHAEELNFLFHRFTSPAYLSDVDASVRQRMVRMWTNFAKYFNPTPIEDESLQNIKWAKCAPFPDMSYLDIGENLVVRKNPRQVDMDFWSNLVETYGNKPFTVY